MRAPALVACCILVAGCAATSTSPVTRASSDASQSTWSTGVTVIPEAQRQPAPPLQGATLDGGQLDVAALRPSTVVVNAWASWCAPCREEAPALAAVAAATRGDGVRVVGLDVNDDPSRARAFAEEVGMDYPSIVDRSGALLATIPGIPPTALPSTIVIDSSGRIAARIIGPVSESTLLSVLAQVS